MLLTLSFVLFAIGLPQHQGMPFNQDAVVHHFTIEPSGGTIAISVKDPAPEGTLAMVQSHLREIAAAFGRGDFSASIATHGEVPAGVERLQALKGEIRYRYTQTADGGKVTIRTTSDPAREAVHTFLRYQIREHHTGDKGVVQ